mmetsp:Transcript_10321/g.26715  ORF Transcript_10321/g.26715 Transcript_10321/m.26715 type:complete len:295 (-) Transcript_10321:1831-2715(-)
MLEALHAVHGLNHRHLRGGLQPLLHLVYDLRGRGAEGGDGAEGGGFAEDGGDLAKDHLSHGRVHVRALEIRDKAEVGKRRHQLVVQVVLARELEQFQHSLQAVQQFALPTGDLIRLAVRGDVARAIQHKGLQKLVCLLHWIFLQQLLTLWIFVDLLGFPSGGSGSLGVHLFFLLVRLSLQLVLQFFLVSCAQIILIALASSIALGDGFAAGLHVEELDVDFDGVLGCSAEELVRIQLLLHAKHTHVGLKRRLPQAVVVEVELVLRNVTEVLEGFTELLQCTSILLLPDVTSAHM